MKDILHKLVFSTSTSCPSKGWKWNVNNIIIALSLTDSSENWVDPMRSMSKKQWIENQGYNNWKKEN